MSDRAYHDYDGDRDVITCVTLRTRTRAMPRSPPSPGQLSNRPGSCSSRSAGIRTRCYSTITTDNPCALRAGESSIRPEGSTKTDAVGSLRDPDGHAA